MPINWVAEQNAVNANVPLVNFELQAFLPQVGVKRDEFVTVPIVNLTLEPFLPEVKVISQPITVEVPLADMTIQAFMPTIVKAAMVTPITADISIQAIAPEIIYTRNQSVDVGMAYMEIEAFAPEVNVTHPVYPSIHLYPSNTLHPVAKG